MTTGTTVGAYSKKTQLRGSMSEAEFEQILKQFPSLSEPMRSLVRRVMVDSEPMAAVAAAERQNRQAIWYWCHRLDQARVPKGYVRVNLVVSKALAASFKAMAKAEASRQASGT